MSLIFVTKGFDRFVRKQRIDESALIARIDQADAGIVDANLKGCFVKLRLAREGEGKAGGYRNIVAYLSGDRTFFLYGFSKNEKETSTPSRQMLLRLTDQFFSIWMRRTSKWQSMGKKFDS